MDMQQIEVMILGAEKAGACERSLRELKKCNTVEEVLEHENAPFWAYWYALHVLHGRFPEGEAAISQDDEMAYLYARYVLKGRFEQGEAAIAQSACWAHHYARYALKGRFEQGEAAISEVTCWARLYAMYVPGAPVLRKS